jgi:hypothetical protein
MGFGQRILGTDGRLYRLAQLSLPHTLATSIYFTFLF